MGKLLALLLLSAGQAHAVNSGLYINFPVVVITSVPAPGSPVFANVYGTSVTVSYSNSLTSGYNGYEVDGCTNSDFTGVCFSSSTTNPAATSLTVIGMAYSTLYYFRAGTISGQTTTYANTSPISTTTTASPSDPLDPSLRPSILGSTITAAATSAGITVAASDSLQKVFNNTATLPSASSITLTCVINDWCSGQVHVQAGAGGITGLAAGQFTLTNAQSSVVIGSSDSWTYSERGIKITTPSNQGSVTIYGSTGMYVPDILVPLYDHYFGQWVSSYPVTVAANQNASFWFSVHIPTYAPSGWWRGTIPITTGTTVSSTGISPGVAIASITIFVAVIDTMTPSTPALITYMGTEPLGISKQNNNNNAEGAQAAAYPCANGCGISNGQEPYILGLQTVDANVMCMDHRITCLGNVTPTINYYNNSSTASFRAIFEPAIMGNNNNGNIQNIVTVLPGARATTIQGLATTLATNATAQAFMTEAVQRVWPGSPTAAMFFNVDEPAGGDNWSNIIKFSTAMHTANPPIPILCTTSIANINTNAASNGCDWVTPALTTLEVQGVASTTPTYTSFLAATATNPAGPKRLFFSYDGCISENPTCANGSYASNAPTWTYPNPMVDAPPVVNRVFEWMTYLHNQVGELYYDFDYCANQACSVFTSGGVVTSTDSWDTVLYSGGNGDGTLRFQCSNRRCGVAKPFSIPSVRLEHKRDGIQDYEMFRIMNDLGLATTPNSIIYSVVTNSYTFNQNTDNFASARRRALNAIHAYYHPGSAGSPL